MEGLTGQGASRKIASPAHAVTAHHNSLLVIVAVIVTDRHQPDYLG